MVYHCEEPERRDDGRHLSDYLEGVRPGFICFTDRELTMSQLYREHGER